MHPFAKIKTVRPMSLHAGIKRQRITSQCNSLTFQPVEQQLT